VRRAAGSAPRWVVVAVGLVAVAELFGRGDLPTPYLFAAFAVGIAYALVARWPLTLADPLAVVAQGVIGVTAGSYLERSTMVAVGGNAAPILGVCVLTVALSVLAGLVLARFAAIDRPTATFGMIAGGAAGIVAISRDLDADERLVAVMQYVRVLIIVAVTPVVAIGGFGMTRTTRALVHGSSSNVHGFAYVGVVLAAGLLLARAVKLPAGSILGPMIVAGTVSLAYPSLVAPIPLPVADVAFACIGLDVGLRFTPKTLRSAGTVLPRSVAVIVGMLIVSAGFGVVLAWLTDTSQLDGYLATTPGGLSAVLAMAAGSRTNTTFIVSVQVIRTFLMLAAAPPLAAWLSSRGDVDFETSSD
jgi:uncharacterized protein